jgi:hypothetical protein
MFRSSSVPIIRSYQLYTWQLVCFMQVMWPLPRRVRLELSSNLYVTPYNYESYKLQNTCPSIKVLTSNERCKVSKGGLFLSEGHLTQSLPGMIAEVVTKGRVFLLLECSHLYKKVWDYFVFLLRELIFKEPPIKIFPCLTLGVKGAEYIYLYNTVPLYYFREK